MIVSTKSTKCNLGWSGFQASQSLTDREQEVPSYGATQSNKEPATAGEDVNLASESSHKPADQSLSPVRGEQAPPIITPKSETPPNYQYST